MPVARLLASAVVVLATTSLITSSAAATAVRSVTDGATFNKPYSHTRSDQYRIPVQVIIDAVSRTLYNDDTGEYYPNPAYTRLVDGLGTDKASRSWIMHCTPDAACIGNQNTPINHNKFFLFSNTAGASNVVVQASANLTNSQARNGWNNAVTIVGNTTMFDSYLQYFDDLAAMNKTNDYYRKTYSGPYASYYFPRAGTDRSTDTVYNILGNVDCSGGTRIRLAMLNFTRTAVAKRLWDMDDQGCRVQVIYTDLGVGARDRLTKPGGKNGGPTLRHSQNIYIDADGNAQAMYVHSKYLLIDGTYLGKTKKLVFTGSHNYTVSALRENDETLLKIDDAGVYGAFAQNYADLWDSAPATLTRRQPPLKADLPPHIRREADLDDR